MPKPSVAPHFLVMMRTFSARLRAASRSSIGRPARAVTRARERLLPTHRSLASEAGDTLIEVLVSAILVALIVVAMFNGFDVTSRASASERSRAQADALAQQAEDQLRGLPISTLTELASKPRVEEVTQNGTKYTITSTAQYVEDKTSTTSCNAANAESADYIRTVSTVTWPALGTRKPVIESGIISPPPGSALIVQVTNAAGEGVAGMTVTATGPAPATTAHELNTAANGCAILALLPGEYAINVSQTGYVDENWYSESKLDPHSTHSVYLTAESAAKESYRFGMAGTLAVKFTTESAPSEGDSFVAFDSLMTSSPPFRQIGTLGKYEPTVKSEPKVFPFTGEAGYTVYAGTCEANNPVTVNPENSPLKPVSVPAGSTGEVTVPQPPINIRVMSGTKAGEATEGVEVQNAKGTLVEPKHEESPEHSGCGETRKFTTTEKGALPHPGMPFGEYKLCVTGGTEGGIGKEKEKEVKGLAKEKKYTTTAFFENGLPAGPTKVELAKISNSGEVVEEAGKKFAVIYLGAGEKETACP